MHTKTVEKLEPKYAVKIGGYRPFSATKKVPLSLRGILKDILIAEHDFRRAKKSLFRKPRV